MYQMLWTMTNPVFLIDGFTEKLILQKICPGVKINLINCNGSSVSISAIAKRVSSLIRLMNNRHYPIFVLIDREDRAETADIIASQLEKEIRNTGIKDDLRIGICDRMIENWTLADWASFKLNAKLAEDTIAPAGCEGLSGKGLVKKLYPGYQETTDGVGFFLKADPNVIYENSVSFRNFVKQTEDINCFWSKNLLIKFGE